MKTYYLVESFYGGSHKKWIDQLVRNIDLNFEVFSLKDRHWKWRNQGSALQLSQDVNDFFKKSNQLPEGIIVTSIIDLNLFKNLLDKKLRDIPFILYFHENQFAYPFQTNSETDMHYPFLNFTSALAADRCLFNSRYNKKTFLDGARSLLKRMPDYNQVSRVDEIESKASVLPLGLELNTQKIQKDFSGLSHEIRILWNHRWEHDKNPDSFFYAMKELIKDGLNLKICLAGERNKKIPESFNSFIKEYPNNVKSSHLLSKDEYFEALRWAHFCPNTSTQDFFGISLIEAMSYGVIPIVPDRMAFPEHFESIEIGPKLLYKEDSEILDIMKSLMVREDLPLISQSCQDISHQYLWNHLAQRYLESFKVNKS